MASLLEQESAKEFTPHELITGEVVQVDQDVAFVNVNYKEDIPIIKRELAFPEPASAKDVVSVGDEIKVYVVSVNPEGCPTLSKVRADRLAAWDDVMKLLESGEIITVTVSDVVKGGLICNACGLRGFIPASQLDVRFVKELNGYKGQELAVKVIEVDPRKQRFVLSRKVVLEKELQAKKEELLASIIPGEIKNGEVKRIVDYGAFIDIGGIDGLCHISDLSWFHVKHPSEVLNIGDKVSVLIKSFEPESQRISLSIKDTTKDPWLDTAEKYPVGTVVEGEIVKIADFGAFLEIEKGFDGLIRTRELSTNQVHKPSDVVKLGDKVKAKVLHIDTENKRVALSIARLIQDMERADYENYMANKE